MAVFHPELLGVPIATLSIFQRMQTGEAFDLDRTRSILTRTPTCLKALLQGLPDFWVQQDEGTDTWTPFGIVGHLIFADRTDWMPRLRRILEHGEQIAFDPFDRLGHIAASRGKTLDQLLGDFAELRSECLAELHKLNLQPQDLEKRGKHPALGTVRASELLATWAVHDLNHLHQLSRVMAHQYRDSTGPFQAYLGVLHCTGHGA
ncbi:MAG TPA: DinB family protein [Terriglobales bacterium]|jgi:hypothetical protein|nr:DinB family protein [Terriglobales bacterium]